MKERIDIPAANKKDLLSILTQYGLADKLQAGTIECRFCSERLSWDGLGGFLVLEGKPVLFCNLMECTEKAREESLHG